MPKARSNKLQRSLPKKLIAIGNKDKEFHEQWEVGRDPLNFPHPFRVCLSGPPNTGKSTCVKNIILRANPRFKRVTIIHADPQRKIPKGDGNPDEQKGTHEYEDLGEHGVEMREDIPNPSEFDSSEKTMVVIDDIDLASMTKAQRSAADRLLGYVSTHKNISVCVCLQDFFRCPVNLRRNCNVFVIWNNPDKSSMGTLGKRLGIPNFAEFMEENCPEKHDSLWKDETHRTPYPWRFNGYDLFHFNNEESDSD